jgi:exonuclease III
MWNCLGWNIRGINSQAKWDVIHSKICKNHCSIICLQKTKQQHFDDCYVSKFTPSHLKKFAFSPSVGASKGLITIWNDSMFDGFDQLFLLW